MIRNFEKMKSKPKYNFHEYQERFQQDKKNKRNNPKHHKSLHPNSDFLNEQDLEVGIEEDVFTDIDGNYIY